MANTFLGMPDLGLMSSTELARTSPRWPTRCDPARRRRRHRVRQRPQRQRTVRELERAGAAAIQIEDQVIPKKCGHFAGKEVVSTEEMVGKLGRRSTPASDDDLYHRSHRRARHRRPRAGVRARRRLPRGGRRRLLRRGADLAGAARQSPARCRAARGEHGRGRAHAASCCREELDELGFAIALYANAAMRGAVRACARCSNTSPSTGTPVSAVDLMITWEERQALVRKPEFDALEARYAAKDEPPACETGPTERPGTARRPGPPGGTRPAALDVLVDDGRIAALSPPARGRARDARRVRPPSCPGSSTRTSTSAPTSRVPRTPEDVRPETAAAAAGGVTRPRLPHVRRAVRRRLPDRPRRDGGRRAVDFGFHFCIGTREQLEAVPATSPTSASAPSSSS